MSVTRATIGIDVGTSAVKGLLVGLGGQVLASASRGYPLLTPAPGWTEQDPEQWWQASLAVLQELAAFPEVEIAGLGLAGQMHGSVFLDTDDEVIRPALLWNDGRTGEQAQQIEQRVGRTRLIEISGNAASAGMQAPKLLWLQQNEPAAHARIRRLLLPKDFVRLRLTGEHVTDPADASGTLLVDRSSIRAGHPEGMAADGRGEPGHRRAAHRAGGSPDRASGGVAGGGRRWRQCRRGARGRGGPPRPGCPVDRDVRDDLRAWRPGHA
jgi:sugar (pentulose or hexulose) kinase